MIRRLLPMLAVLIAPLCVSAQESDATNGHATTVASPAPGAPDSVVIPGTQAAIDLVFIPGGTFEMGSPETDPDRDSDEGPQRTMSVSPFWMGRTEVTFDQFAIFRFRDMDTDTTASPDIPYEIDAVARPSPPYEDPSFGMGNEGYPAVSMTQWGALHFAKWLSEKTGHFFRLPTEAEWEFACRAGSDGARPFPDRDLNRNSWYWDNSGERFQKVGSLDPNAWGLHDMLGNVSEWTMDQYVPDYFEVVSDEDPWVEPTSLHPRTVRGGAYDDDPEALRCSARLESNMAWKRRDPQIPKSFWWNTDSPFVGFRLVRPVNPPSREDQEMFWMMVLGE